MVLSDNAWFKRLLIVVRVIGGACGALTLILGIIGLTVFHDIAIKVVIFDIYSIIFGLLIMITEFRLKFMLGYFKFLTFYPGVSFFYVFVAGLTLTQAWYGIAVASVEFAVAGVYLLLTLLRQSMFAPSDRDAYKQKLAGQAPSTSAQSAQTAAPKFADPFGRDRNPGGAVSNTPKNASQPTEPNSAPRFQDPFGRDQPSSQWVSEPKKKSAYDTSGEAAANPDHVVVDVDLHPPPVSAAPAVAASSRAKQNYDPFNGW